MMVLISMYQSIIYSVIAMCLSSILVRQSFIVLNQHWVKTKSNLILVLLLPIITYTITSVISDNLALSLGMVGALSIVRFRNPVKSPLELVLYFLLITIGVASSVDIKWPIFLTILVLLINYSVFIIDKFFLKFITSFSEGNSLNTLEVFLKIELTSLMESKYFSGCSINAENNIYRFASEDINVLKNIIEELKQKKITIDKYNILSS